MLFQINPYSMLIGVGFTINNLTFKAFLHHYEINSTLFYVYLSLSDK